MARINLKGMGVALITPFHKDKSIDFDSLARLLEYQIRSGIDYLVVLGTTAETATLTPDEQAQVRHFVAERVHGRVPMVLGLGGNNTCLSVAIETYPTHIAGLPVALSVNCWADRKAFISIMDEEVL